MQFYLYANRTKYFYQLFISFYQVQTEIPSPKAPSVEMVEQSMQVELSMKDESLQTSLREEDKKEPEEIVLAGDVVPHVADKLMTDIVQRMPIKVPTDTQNTITETVTTVEQVTQTTPRSESMEVAQSGSTEPYEINIETSFVIPDDAKAAPEPSGTPVVLEIQKTFVIDETQPGNVREVESTTKEKVKKSKSKKKKKRPAGYRADSDDEPMEIVPPVARIDEDKSVVQVESTQEQPEQADQKPTVVTINITKTTVYETSNLVGREAQPHNTSVRIEEVLSDDNVDAPLSPGNFFQSISFGFEFINI